MRISVTEAVHLLSSGQIVGIPTETVYGLAASLHHPQAIQQIYKIKGRPSNNPLIIHVAQLSDIYTYLSEWIPHLEILAQDFWPGPMTIVLPVKTTLIPAVARADLPTAAFRIPEHHLALELLKLTGPLVMPSANLSGRPSATQPKHVEVDFGEHFPVLDGGICNKGVESTILIHRLGEWEIIRQGALSAEHFTKTLGYKPLVEKKTGHAIPQCPGQMYRHYAPQAKLNLATCFDNIKEGVIIGFNDKSYPENCKVLALGPLSNPEEVARNLYSVLRQLDQEGHVEAYVDMNFTEDGLLATLAERLYKAASLSNNI